jgi:hypothetical protein
VTVPGWARRGQSALAARPGGAAAEAVPGGPALAAATIARAAYGAALCCAPGVLLRLEGGAGTDSGPHARAVARVLGGRHLAQAFLSAARPTPAVLALGAGSDVLHSASMVALGLLDRPRRRLGLTDGLIAVTFALAGAGLAGRRAAAGSAPAVRAPEPAALPALP